MVVKPRHKGRVNVAKSEKLPWQECRLRRWENWCIVLPSHAPIFHHARRSSQIYVRGFIFERENITEKKDEEKSRSEKDMIAISREERKKKVVCLFCVLVTCSVCLPARLCLPVCVGRLFDVCLPSPDAANVKNWSCHCPKS